MSEIVALVPEPKTLCKECVENARHQDENFGIIWCEHAHYGGLYLVAQGQWQVVGPFAEEAAFKRYLAWVLAPQRRVSP